MNRKRPQVVLQRRDFNVRKDGIYSRLSTGDSTSPEYLIFESTTSAAAIRRNSQNQNLQCTVQIFRASPLGMFLGSDTEASAFTLDESTLVIPGWGVYHFEPSCEPLQAPFCYRNVKKEYFRFLIYEDGRVLRISSSVIELQFDEDHALGTRVTRTENRDFDIFSEKFILTVKFEGQCSLLYLDN